MSAPNHSAPTSTSAPATTASPTATPSAPPGGRRGRPNRPTLAFTVIRKEYLSPHLLRVVLGGPAFRDFANNDYTDRYVKLVFDQDGETRLRTYTVRWVDPDAEELAIDFVVHGHGDSPEGIAAPWAVGARIGDVLHLRGPGGAYRPQPDAAGHLLVGDEAALPAIASALEAMPSGARVRVVVEVGSPADQIELHSPATIDLTWLHRDAPDAGPDALVTAVRELDMDLDGVQCFIHGELDAMRRIRAHLVGQRQVDPDRLSLSGYWRRGKDEEGFQAEKASDRQR